MFFKVCGLKYKENIEQVAALKPNFMGFIFYAESKRFVGENFEMPKISNEIKKVGVFVNASSTYIIDKVDFYKLDMVQLHGDESPEFCDELSKALFIAKRDSFREKAKGMRAVSVIKAFGMDVDFNFEILEKYQYCCDYFLFDAKTKEYGGSGKTFDWKILEKYDNKIPFFLSGGIGVAEIEKLKNWKIGKLNFYAIDVNSLFEIEPGMKDVYRLKEIMINS